MPAGRNAFVAAGALLVLAGLGAAWFLPHGQGKRDIAAGAALYARHCAGCHGRKLQGQPGWRTPNPDGTLPAPPHDETGHTWHHDDAMLFAYTKLGGQAALARSGITDFKSAMPGFAGVLTDGEIRDVLAYIESTWPERIRSARAQRLGGG